MINKHKRLTAYFKFKILTQKYFKNSSYDMPLIYKTIYFLMHQIKHIKKLDNTWGAQACADLERVRGSGYSYSKKK